MIRRKSGVNSAYLNLPQEFLLELQRHNVNSLMVLYNSFLAAFPNTGENIKPALMMLLQKHSDIKRIFDDSDKNSGDVKDE